MVFYVSTGYQVLGTVYLNQLKGAHHTHILLTISHLRLQTTGDLIPEEELYKIYYLLFFGNKDLIRSKRALSVGELTLKKKT